MDAFKTHGAFSWSELMTPEPAQAAEFYGSLFGWKLEAMPMPSGKYWVAKVGEVPVAGLMLNPDPSSKQPPHWSCYVTVDNVERAIDRCKELGGAVLLPAMDVPTVGRMACISDKQGAAIHIISYAPKA